jgi:hypothetical protein
MGTWRYSSTILEIGMSASRPGRFTVGIEPRYQLNRKLDGLQSLSERCGEEKDFDPAGNRIVAVQPQPPSLYGLGYQDSFLCTELK